MPFPIPVSGLVFRAHLHAACVHPPDSRRRLMTQAEQESRSVEEAVEAERGHGTLWFKVTVAWWQREEQP